jgi:hypothetical protein
VLVERPQGGLQVRRSDVVELSGDHGRLDLLAPGAREPADRRTAGGMTNGATDPGARGRQARGRRRTGDAGVRT